MSVQIPTASFLGINPHARDASSEAFRRRYLLQMRYLRARLGVPSPERIYSLNLSRLERRPRLHFGDLTLPGLARRVADPRFADVVTRTHAIAARVAASTPPETIEPHSHDPSRFFADSLSVLAMSVLMEADPVRRDRTLAGLLKWIRAFELWGPFDNNLPLSQATLALSNVYDWLHDILLPSDLARVGKLIVANVRAALDESHGGYTMWRGQRFAANHNWAHHSARFHAALALWADDLSALDASLEQRELRFWLDDALENMWIAAHTHSDDGAPMEGPTYDDYALRFQVDFAVNATFLLNLHTPFFDDHLRKKSNRLHTLLPGNKSWFNYADGGSTEWWDSASNFRRLASTYRDGNFQLLGEILANSGDRRSLPNWRDLLGYDPEIPPARLADLPLFKDMPDFGLYTARGDWGPDAAFFGLRCGPASAASVTEKFGFDFGEGHIYPNQGDLSFHIFGKPVFPGCGYAKTKLTSNHNLVVFQGRDSQANRLVGQLGEGGPWFNSKSLADPHADYENRHSTPSVLASFHGADYHHYLCDLGGLYLLRDERVPGGTFFPSYLRSLIFLPEGAIAIVDRVRLPVERSFSFRLLTAATDLRLDTPSAATRGFGFTVASLASRIDDFSTCRSGSITLATAIERLPTTEFSAVAVASLHAENTRDATFAVVVSVGPAARGYQIVTDARGYSLSAPFSSAVLRIEWPADLAPTSAPEIVDAAG